MRFNWKIFLCALGLIAAFVLLHILVPGLHQAAAPEQQLGAGEVNFVFLFTIAVSLIVAFTTGKRLTGRKTG